MAEFETVEVPIVRLSDGRQFVTDQSVAEAPYLMQFIGMFSNYWQRDDLLCGWVSPLHEDAA